MQNGNGNLPRSRWHSIDWKTILSSSNTFQKPKENANGQNQKEKQGKALVANMLFLRSGLIRKDLLPLFARCKGKLKDKYEGHVVGSSFFNPTPMGMNGCVTSYEELKGELKMEIIRRVR